MKDKILYNGSILEYQIGKFKIYQTFRHTKISQNFAYQSVFPFFIDFLVYLCLKQCSNKNAYVFTFLQKI